MLELGLVLGFGCTEKWKINDKMNDGVCVLQYVVVCYVLVVCVDPSLSSCYLGVSEAKIFRTRSTVVCECTLCLDNFCKFQRFTPLKLTQASSEGICH